MGAYSAQGITAAPAAGAPVATFRTSTYRALITEIHFWVSTAVAMQLSHGRPANTPVASASKLGQSYTVNAPPSLENVDTAWSTPPTAPTNFLMGTFVAATIGTGVIWVMQPVDPIEVVPNSWYVLWNGGAAVGPAGVAGFKWSL